jgi:hypothetical protein
VRTVCLAIRQPYLSASDPTIIRSPDRAREHFVARGVDAQFFYGIDASRARIVATVPYDSPYDRGPTIEVRRVGNWLSHRALWSACLLLPDDRFFLLEDDAEFPLDWRPRLDQAIRDAGEFDVLYVGSCHTSHLPRRHIAGAVYEVKWPLCLHGYLVSGHRVLKRLIATQEDRPVYTNMDISLPRHSYADLRVYTMLPRLLEQFDTPSLQP